MTLDWMVYALWLSLLVGGAAWVLDRALVTRGIATRWIWAGALVLSAALPLTLPFASRFVTAPRLPTALPAMLQASRPIDGAQPSWVTVYSAPDEAASVPALRADGFFSVFGWRPRIPELPARADLAVVGLWAVISLAVFGALGRATLRLRRMRSEWRVAELEGHSVLVSKDVGPAVVGLLHSAIVVPSWSLGLPSGERRLILRHEEEHLRAHDLVLLSAAAVLLALFPWNAALWWQTARLRFAVEVDCDRRVLRDPRDLRRYAMLLIEIGRRPTLSRVPALAISQSPSILERRILTMTRRSKPRLITTAALILAGALIGATAVQVQRPDVSHATSPVLAPSAALSAPSAAALANGNSMRVGEIRGTVKDPNSGALLTEVHVTLVDTNLSSVSSNTGGYVIADVPAGTYELRAERIGYAKVSKQVTVTDRQVLTVDLEMVTGTALPNIASATTGRLMGIVRDASGAPLADAQVSIVKPDGSALVGGISRVSGAYLLLNVPPGTYEARVRREGSAGAVRPVTMAAGGIVELNFQLATPGGESTSSLVEPNLQKEEIIRALANRPPNPDGSPAIVIDGVLMDQSYALPTTTGAATGAAVGGINPNDIERVEIIKGEAASTLYGQGAANGVIHVILKKPPEVSSSALDRAQELQRAAASLARRMAEVTPPTSAGGAPTAWDSEFFLKEVLGLETGPGAAATAAPVSVPVLPVSAVNTPTAALPAARRPSAAADTFVYGESCASTIARIRASTDSSRGEQVYGCITNAANGQPITNARVRIGAGAQTRGTTATREGFFFLPMPSGTYDLLVEREGFKPLVIPVLVTEAGPLDMKAVLTPQP